MMDASQIREHMKVVGTNGQPIGTVDRVEGNRIKLTKGDSAEHRYVELSEVSEIKDGEVCVSGNHTAHTGQTKTDLSQNQNGGQPGQNQMERRDQDPIAQSQGGQQQGSGQNGEFGKHVAGPGKAQQMNQNGEIKPATKGSTNPGDKRG